MAVQSIVCGTCEAAVPYGRLSCPSCGELLASVARPRRPARSAARAEAPPAAPSGVPDVLYQVEPPTATIAADQPSPEPASRDLDAELPWMSDAADGDAAEPEADVEAPSGSADDGDDVDTDVDAPEELDDLDDGTATLPGSTWALGATSLAGTPTPSYMPRPGRPADDRARGRLRRPGRLRAADARRRRGRRSPSRRPAPGPATPPSPVSPTPVPEPPTRRHAGTRRRDRRPARAAPGVRRLARRSPAPPSPRVGFLLPWGLVDDRRGRVSTTSTAGASPGPATSSSWPACSTILALTLVTNPVPVWIRTGLAGLGLGALLFGLVWPYLIGPLGSGPGVPIVAVGAIGARRVGHRWRSSSTVTSGSIPPSEPGRHRATSSGGGPGYPCYTAHRPHDRRADDRHGSPRRRPTGLDRSSTASARRSATSSTARSSSSAPGDRHLPRHPVDRHRRTGRSGTCSSARTTRSCRTSSRPGSSCSPRSSSSSRSGSTRSSGRTRRSARSGSATWPRRRSSPRSRRSTTARPASGGSTRNGSSARRAGPGSTASAPTARAWSASTGRCARGAARTSSAVTSSRPARSSRSRPASRRPAACRRRAAQPSPRSRPRSRRRSGRAAGLRALPLRRAAAQDPLPERLTGPAQPDRPDRPGRIDIHHRGPLRARPVRARLAGDAARPGRDRGRGDGRVGAATPILLFGGLVVLSVGLVAGAGSPGDRAQGPRGPRLPRPVAVPRSSRRRSRSAGPARGRRPRPRRRGRPGRRAARPSRLGRRSRRSSTSGSIRLLVVDTGALSLGGHGHPRPSMAGRRGSRRGRRSGRSPVILATIPVAAILTRFSRPRRSARCRRPASSAGSC